MPSDDVAPPDLRDSCFATVGAVYVLFFSEWLFQVTKPSFMSALSSIEVLRIALASPLYLIIALLLVQTGLFLVQRLLGRATRRSLPSPGPLIPAALYAVTLLLLVDNFIYTMFGVGIVTLSGPGRALGGAALIATFAWIARSLYRAASTTRSAKKPTPAGQRLVLGMLALSLITASWETAIRKGSGALNFDREGDGDRLPDILFITLDGVTATHTSVYGYRRNTTPNLATLAREALVFDNAFTNNCFTTGALTAFLTGKLPTDVNLFYTPMRLRGDDAYEHLPGVLRSLGYRSSQITARWWMNAMSQGMRGAFDSVNFNDVRAEELAWIPASWADRLPAQRDFLVQTRDRIEHRALHLFGIQEMPDYMGTARNRMKGTAAFSDAQRRDGVIDFLSQESNQPSFVQVHFMTGHCCKYQISKGEQHFSVGRTYRGGSVDHYDDAIRYMDSMVGDILEWLEQEGRLDETLIVVSSDHSRNWETEERLPLLIRFPGGMPKGHIQPSAQLIDVPPTMIEYLGLRQPEWMVGESLLGNNALDPQRPIFSASKVKVAAFRKPKPPLYGLEAYSAVICDRWYRLQLEEDTMTSGLIDGHVGECDPNSILSEAQARSLILQHLEERGFVPSGEEQRN